MVLACAAPLLPNIPRLPLGICSRTTVTQALNDTTQHITWLLLVCAGFVLSDCDRHESRDWHIQTVLKTKFGIGQGKDCHVPNIPNPQNFAQVPEQKAAEVEDDFYKDVEPWRVTR